MQHEVTEHVLRSGAKGLFVNVPGAAVYNLVIRFNSGFQFGDFKHYELPHVVEHLISCGSKAYPEPNQLKIEFTKNGAFRNAMTSSRVNGYVLECASFELDRIMDLLTEYLTAPLFPEAALATELSNVADELRRNTTEHDRELGIAIATAVAPAEYLTYEPRIAQLESITRDDVVKYYKRTHTAANARFYIAGEIDAQTQTKLLARLEAMFERLPAGKRLIFDEQPGLNVPSPILIKRDIEQIYYSCGIYGKGVDDTIRRALKLLRVMLFIGYGSSIYGELRRLGIAYDITGSIGASPDSSDLTFSGNVSPGHAEELFRLVVKEIARLRTRVPSKSELEAAINLTIGSLDRSYQTVASVMGYYMGLYDAEERIVDLVAEKALIRQLTPADIKQAAGISKAGAAHSLGLLGPVDEDVATRLEKIASSLWI